jgi:hypothetical protein
VGTEHICYYKESAFVHGIEPSDMDDLWVRWDGDSPFGENLRYLKGLFKVLNNFFCRDVHSLTSDIPDYSKTLEHRPRNWALDRLS